MIRRRNGIALNGGVGNKRQLYTTTTRRLPRAVGAYSGVEKRPQPARIQPKTESEAKLKGKRAEGIPQETHPPTLVVHTRSGVPSVWLCTPVRSMTAMFGCGGGGNTPVT